MQVDKAKGLALLALFVRAIQQRTPGYSVAVRFDAHEGGFFVCTVRHTHTMRTFAGASGPTATSAVRECARHWLKEVRRQGL